MKIINVDQAKAWDGDDGRFWAEHDEHFNASLVEHGAKLIEAAAIGSHENVLDVGCGAGESTRMAARLARNGSVLGVDLSGPMLAKARERADAEGLTNIRFEKADAQAHEFEREAYDLVISRFGVMFFLDPIEAFSNIGKALRPDGRMVFMVWQEMPENEWLTAVRDALAAGRDFPVPPPGTPSPVSLGNRQFTREVFAKAGFQDVTFEEFIRPMSFGKSADDAIAFMTSSRTTKASLDSIEDETLRKEARDNLYAVLKTHETPEGVMLGSSAWIINARR